MALTVTVTVTAHVSIDDELLLALVQAADNGSQAAMSVEEVLRHFSQKNTNQNGDENPDHNSFTAIFAAGDDLFDKSFTIENGQSDFWGECGVSLADKSRTAFEIWLFDKNDVQTKTVFLAISAADKENLSVKGTVHEMFEGQVIVVETATLKMGITVGLFVEKNGKVQSAEFAIKVSRKSEEEGV